MYTHLTHVHGSELEMVELTRSDEEDKHRDLKQGSKETIGEFIARLKNSYIVMVAAGIPVFTEPQKAVQFLKKLDQTRHGAMFAELRNNAQRGVPLPQTLFEAYNIASHWLVKRSPGVFGYENHSVYLADTASPKENKYKGAKNKEGCQRNKTR